MKSLVIISIICICSLISAFPVALAAEKAPPKIFDLAESKLKAIGSDPIIVNAVKEKNSKGETLDQIKALDEKWINTPGTADFMTEYLENDCARFLIKLQEKQPYLVEVFVMDDQGAITAMTEKTSDYWQGDEAKFKKSFNNGQGAVFVDDIKFDDSTQTYLVQISVPVIDQGRAIGAVTFGVDVDQY